MVSKDMRLIGIILAVFVLIIIDSTLLANAEFGVGSSLVLIVACGALYAFVLVAVLMPRGKQVVKEVIRTVEKPVVKEVIKYVDRPVYKEVIKEKPVYIEKRVNVEVPRKKLNIPHYNYVGSTQTKRYHKHSCRLGKLIKKKFKVSSNSTAVFKKRRFRPCKACMKKK